MIDAVMTWLSEGPEQIGIIDITIVLGLALLVYLLIARGVAQTVVRFAERSKSKIDDMIVDRVKPRRLSLIAPLFVIYYFAFFISDGADIIRTIVLFASLWLGVVSVNGLLDSFNDIYESRSEYTGQPIEGYMDLLKILVLLVGIILSISLITGQSPVVLLTGLGALSAMLLLVFRDTILGLVASFQINANDLVKEGDWLEVPDYEADGAVIQITLHQIKIQNWDKTISVVPTYKILEVAYKNWRGMSESGGRRIKRSLNLDINSVAFLDNDMIEKCRRIQILRDYIDTQLAELADWNQAHGVDESVLVNGRRMTNMGTFRAYVEAYLKNHSQIRKDMTLLVRQLPSGPNGIPIEIYAFTNTTDWLEYEDIQADIFDHLLAVVPEFGLQVFQDPSGADFGGLLRSAH